MALASGLLRLLGRATARTAASAGGRAAVGPTTPQGAGVFGAEMGSPRIPCPSSSLFLLTSHKPAAITGSTDPTVILGRNPVTTGAAGVGGGTGGGAKSLSAQRPSHSRLLTQSLLI